METGVTMNAISAEQWLLIIALGGIAGALGQVLRVIVGLKKANDEAAAKGLALSEVIVPSRLVISIIIGFAAGAVAALIAPPPNLADVGAGTILAFAAAGYSGADFIESAMSKFLPGGQPAAAAANATPQKPNAPDDHLG